MALITLDFETFYRSRANKKEGLASYSLKTLTYEEYINHPEFKIYGCGIKHENSPTVYYRGDALETKLSQLFGPGNSNTLLCHNTMFDSAILSWVYGLHPAFYCDTMGMSAALWPHSKASLDALTRRLWPKDKSKWKGKELVTVDGVRDLSPEQDKVIEGYCIQDVDITYWAFMEMSKYLPTMEYHVINIHLRSWAERPFVLDRPEVEKYLARLEKTRAEKIAASGIPESVLNSNVKFAARLEKDFGIVVKEIPSPTEKNPDNTKLPLSKGDREFVELQMAHPELKHVWEGRIACKSVGEIQRAKRLLIHSQKTKYNPEERIGVPLKYYAAHTGRSGGTNKVNFQNFKRGSPLRYALHAPKGFKVNVRDLSNIEGRLNAWFNEQEDKCQAFAEGRDLYNEIASDIFGYPVDRKKKLRNESGQLVDQKGAVVDNYDDAAYEFEVEGFVGKQCELGLGYGMGAPKFGTTCFLQGGLSFEDKFLRNVVTLWRSKNYKIKDGWRLGDRAIFDMASPACPPYSWRCLRVERNALALPNGLKLSYPGLQRVEKETEQGIKIEWRYWNGRHWANTWGGTLMENIIQALARILMMWMMVNIDECLKPLGGRVVMSVHDEIVAIVPDEHAEAADKIMEEEMSRLPDWINDDLLVLTSEGGYAHNYSK